jgi:hypothetical protein
MLFDNNSYDFLPNYYSGWSVHEMLRRMVKIYYLIINNIYFYLYYSCKKNKNEQKPIEKQATNNNNQNLQEVQIEIAEKVEINYENEVPYYLQNNNNIGGEANDNQIQDIDNINMGEAPVFNKK